jgi:hypothetical protein
VDGHRLGGIVCADRVSEESGQAQGHNPAAQQEQPGDPRAIKLRPIK